MTLSLTSKVHWPDVCTSNQQNIFFFLRKVACYASNRMVLYCMLRSCTNFSAGCRSEFVCFITITWVKHEKLCNFELLSFEIGRTYLTSFRINYRKNVLFQLVSIITSKFKKKIDAAQTTHNSVLCEKWKIVYQNLTLWKSIKFVSNNIDFGIIIKITFQLYELCF